MLLAPDVAGYIVVSLLIVWLALGVHIGVALGLAGFLGIYLTVGLDAASAQLAAIPFSTTNNFALAVIPLFILMGSFATQAGIVTALLYCGGIYVLARWRPDLAPLARIAVTWGERWRSLYGVGGVMILFFIVVGGIYGGYFPATYAGAVGAAGAFVIALYKRR